MLRKGFFEAEVVVRVQLLGVGMADSEDEEQEEKGDIAVPLRWDGGREVSPGVGECG